ncbi:MAG TPA: Rpp14/Pop5 family protein [Candidatus Nanoarchaeia archaeon]|nr:Rpp14/Pop5 family protein [Candidatus Nanoarchaeia archaeon]
MTNKSQRKKPKTLMPSLKEKKRYLVYEVISDEKFSYSDIKLEIINNFKNFFGLEGLGKAGLDFIEYENNKGIVKVSAKGVDMLKASFCFLRKINKGDVVIRSLGLSGMINKARSKFIFGGLN